MKLGRPQILEWFSLQLAVAVGGAVAALVNPWLGILAGGIALPLNFFLLQQGWRTREAPEQNKPMADGLAVAGMCLFVVMLLQSGLILALMTLLYMAMLAMAVQLNNHRKFYLAQVVSFVFIIAGAAEARTGGYLLVLAAYCVTAAFTLTELWLDRGDDRDIPGPPLRQRAAIAGVTMLVAVAVYLVMPRFDALNIGGQPSSSADFYHDKDWLDEAEHGSRTESQQQEYQELEQITDLSGFGDETQENYRYSGFNETFDINTPQRSGTLPLDTVIARMKAPHGAYLKVRSFDTFDGLTWHTSEENIRSKLKTDRSGEVILNEALTGNFIHTVSIEETIPAWLPLAGEPVRLWVPSSVVAVDQFAQPLLPGILKAGTEYTVDAYLDLRDDRPVMMGTRAGPADLQLPDNFDPAITRLAKKVTAGASSSYARAVALEHHLRTAYRYNFQSAMTSQDRTPLSEFLFTTREGHCEYFASAMTMMLRSVGIPARLVTGFSATVRNPLTGYFEIQAVDGHAWTEAWIDGRWVLFEPTAYYNLPEPQQSQVTAEQIRQYAEDIQHRMSAAGEGEFSLSGFISAVWVSLYQQVVMALAWAKWLLVTLWPLWLLLAVTVIVALLTLKKWWPYWRAWRSLQKVSSCPVAEPQDTLHYCLYHMQRIAAVRYPGRSADEDFSTWLYQQAALSESNPALRDLAEQAHSVFYEGSDIASQNIRQTAADAARQLWKSVLRRS